VIDTPSLRDRFPALGRRQNGRPVLFFDNPAGTQVPQEAVDGFTRYLHRGTANVGGAFATSLDTDGIVARARQAMADLLGAESPREIVFGQNMTSLTFSLSNALARLLQPGDEVVTTHLEHDANVAPWLALQDRGVAVRWIDIHPATMTLDLESAETAITDRTRLVALGFASNAFGSVNDVRRVADLAHARGAWVFVDAVHFGPHGPIDVRALGCDLLACSAYKFFGPHLGILYGRHDVLEAIPAQHVRPAGEEPPDSWETGTQSHEALSALLGTVSYLCSLAADVGGDQRSRLHTAMDRIQSYERTLSERLIRGMLAIPGLRVYGITDPSAFDRRVPTVSFTLAGVHPQDGAGALARRGIFSWAGNHYALEPLARLGLPATQRIGLVHYNTPEEIDRFLEELGAVSRELSSPRAIGPGFEETRGAPSGRGGG
jgi:cysteine desulfurase family protein (TIGR01976 family)